MGKEYHPIVRWFSLPYTWRRRLILFLKQKRKS